MGLRRISTTLEHQFDGSKHVKCRFSAQLLKYFDKVSLRNIENTWHDERLISQLGSRKLHTLKVGTVICLSLLWQAISEKNYRISD